jgi:hypothetical protein
MVVFDLRRHINPSASASESESTHGFGIIIKQRCE